MKYLSQVNELWQGLSVMLSCCHLLSSFCKELSSLHFPDYFSMFPAVTWMPELLFDALIVICMFLTPGDVNI